MMAHDDDFFDDVALLALGVLPSAQAVPLAKHVEGCADCRLLFTSLRSTADLVGYQEEALGDRFDEVSRFRLKSRIMKTIRTTEVGPIMPSANGKAASHGISMQRAWLAWCIATAAIFIAAINTISNTSLRDENTSLHAIAEQYSSTAAVAEEQARSLDRRVAEIVTPGAKRYAVHDGVIVAANGRLLIALRDLPTLPTGKVYQAWTRKRGSKIMTPGATFSPDSSGIAFVDVPTYTHDIEAVAVSVEPAAGSEAPTTKPTFVRTLG